MAGCNAWRLALIRLDKDWCPNNVTVLQFIEFNDVGYCLVNKNKNEKDQTEGDLQEKLQDNLQMLPLPPPLTVMIKPPTHRTSYTTINLF